MNRLIGLLIGIVVIAALVSSSLFTVSETRSAIISGASNSRNVISSPGLHMKLPTPLQNLTYVDKRIQTASLKNGERFVTVEKKDILIDGYLKWRVANPEQFFVSASADSKRAQDRMLQTFKAALSEQVATRTAHQIISDEQSELLAAVNASVAADAKEMGIEIIDVRLKRVEYLDEVRAAVFERMKSEQAALAANLRSTGTADAEQIRSDADRQRTVILADAYRDAEKTRGEGDAQAAQIYSQAYGQNPEFYRFYRSLEAYRASFHDRRDVLVVDPSSDFFRYMRGAGLPAVK